MSPQGIFKPQMMELPLTITTTVNSIYDYAPGDDGIFRYKYRGTDPSHRDNRGLKKVMTAGLPLAYFHGLVPGQYLPIWPVYVVGADDMALEFQVATDHDIQLLGHDVLVGEER